MRYSVIVAERGQESLIYNGDKWQSLENITVTLKELVLKGSPTTDGAASIVAQAARFAG